MVNAGSAPFTIPRGLIQLVSGVEARHYADQPVSSADAAGFAGRDALESAGVEPDDVDMLIFAAASSAVLEPATANLVQEAVGCTNARVVDVKNACNSFVDALDIAVTYLDAGRCRRVLVTSGEVNSPSISWTIRDRKDLARRLAGLTLGDAGGAFVLEPSADGAGLGAGRFFSDGRYWRLSTVMSGGTLLRHDFSHVLLDCDSVALNEVGLRYIPGVVSEALEAIGWSPEDLALVVPHQVSEPVIDRLCKLTGIEAARCTKTLRQFGNTAAASIPLGLSLAAEEGRLDRGDRVLLVGASAGFSVGVLPLVW
jgi:acyl-CoA:acyl-CoA alkyltransferase